MHGVSTNSVRVTLSICLPKYEEFEDTKEVIRIRNRRRTDKTMANKKGIKGQTTTYKTDT